jgi:RNA polymerase sigma factor (sigma-70 family)
MRAAQVPARATLVRPPRSRRLLALAGDERLVEQIRAGNDAAFEVAFERHGPAVLGFCRHMLGSPEEAEDAVQQTFASAHRDLQRGAERDIALKPWLFAIARNRCVSMLRVRREQPLQDVELPTAGLAEQVEQRAELRRLLADLRELPDEQRAALLLAEVGDLSHAEVAGVLGCEVPRVKALVFRARSALIARREARETPCEQVREQLATLRGGSLRRTELRLHLRDCPGCRAYREQVKQQRRMLAAALPVAPTLGLKTSVLAAAGIGGGSAGGGAAAGLAGAVGSTTLAKVALVGVLAGGGAVAGDAVLDSQRDGGGRRDAAPAVSGASGAGAASGAEEVPAGSSSPGAGDAERRSKDASSGARRLHNGPPAHARARGRGLGRDGAPPPGRTKARGGLKRGDTKPRKAKSNEGRGRIEAPPATTPVKRGPAEPRPKPTEPAPKVKATAPAAAPPAPRVVKPKIPKLEGKALKR